MRIDINDWRQSSDQDAELTQAPEALGVCGPEPQVSAAAIKSNIRPPDRHTPDVFRDAVIALIPALRIHAATRVGSRGEADDLVQETLVRAWCYRATFREGTNLKAWLCKIMQNCFYHDLSRQRDTIEDIEGRWAAMLSVAPSQEWRLQYNDMLSALDHLPPDARAALILIGASGCSYEEAAELAHCPVGTLKSRVNRAREKLANLIDNGTDIHPRQPVHAPRPFREQACQLSLHISEE